MLRHYLGVRRARPQGVGAKLARLTISEEKGDRPTSRPAPVLSSENSKEGGRRSIDLARNRGFVNGTGRKSTG